MFIYYTENRMRISEVYGEHQKLQLKEDQKQQHEEDHTLPATSFPHASPHESQLVREQQSLLPAVDLLTHYQLVAEPDYTARKTIYKCFKTLYIDLAHDLDILFSAIHRSTRNEINRAAKEGFHFQCNMNPTEIDLVEFCAFYDRFARGKNLPPARRTKLMALLEIEGLVLTSVRDAEKQVLCMHAYISDGERITSLYSASHREEGNKSRNRTISRANKYLHWMDIQFFKEQGYRLYDFGGLSIDARDSDLQNVNQFKLAFGGKEVMEYKYIQARSWRGWLGLVYLRWKWRKSPELLKTVW